LSPWVQVFATLQSRFSFLSKPNMRMVTGAGASLLTESIMSDVPAMPMGRTVGNAPTTRMIPIKIPIMISTTSLRIVVP